MRLRNEVEAKEKKKKEASSTGADSAVAEGRVGTGLRKKTTKGVTRSVGGMRLRHSDKAATDSGKKREPWVQDMYADLFEEIFYVQGWGLKVSLIVLWKMNLVRI